MGVNCNVTLNANAEWRKVGQVACVLLGAEKHREPLGLNRGWHIVVGGFGYGKYQATSDPSYVDILVNGNDESPLVKEITKSDSMPYRLWYGLESRGLYPKATAAKIALAEGIVKFFGGKIVYNDYSNQKRTFKGIANFTGESDASFYRYQTALEALEPLTEKDIERCEKYAGY